MLFRYKTKKFIKKKIQQKNERFYECLNKSLKSRWLEIMKDLLYFTI